MIRLAVFILAALWLPMILSATPAETPPPLDEIALPVPPGITVSATNSAMYRDSAGVIFAASRADTSIGGVVWRVDGYIDREHPGVATYVLNDPKNPQPLKFHANGELSIGQDGMLWYTTTEIESLNNRTTLVLVSHRIKGWTP